MHHKDIKAKIRKQLKKNYPNWNRLNQKKKKMIAGAVLNEVVEDYDFNQEIVTPVEELIGIDGQLLNSHIIDINEMGRFIEMGKNRSLFDLGKERRRLLYIKDKELKFIDDLLDNEVIDGLLAPDCYSPALREFRPSHFLRAELLKSIKYPEISYRKFCGDDKTYKGHKQNSPYIGMENKQNRVFMGLPLNRNKMISHVQMCQFRASLSFSQLVNLTVYILHHLKEQNLLGEDLLHCVDSTELPIERQQRLAQLNVKGKNIRIYDDIDCDCGVRRKKRDKSVYVVGYRMHTLTAIHPKTGYSIPLISLLAPANHHDSHFLSPLVKLGKAIGLDLKLITADEAYHDKDGALYEENGVHLVKPPNSKVVLPENVNDKTLQINFSDFCDIPMEYIGTEDQGHEFKCGDQAGECYYADACPKFRHIPFDDGYFQRIIHGSEEVLKALDIRKNGERPFNLLKKREGLEQVRVRSQHGLVVRATFTTMATLLLELADTRRTKKVTQAQQLELPLAA